MNDSAETIPTLTHDAIVFAPTGLRWYHAGTSLVNWFVVPGQIFRAGDQLYRFCIHQRFAAFDAEERIEYAPCDGILTNAQPPGKRISGGMVLGSFLPLDQWSPYAAMLQRQETAIRMFVEKDRFTEEDPAPLLRECRELRERRQRWLDEIPGLRQETSVLRREVTRELERRRLLSREEQKLQSAETDLRQKYPLAVLLDAFSTADLSESFARDSIAAELAALPELLLAFLEQKYALDSAEAMLLVEESRWILEFSGAFAEFSRERNQIAADHDPQSPALKQNLRVLRRKCQKFLTVALNALSRPHASAAAATADVAPAADRDRPSSVSEDQSPFARSA